ncbi:MAG: hypothetical protein ABI045_02580 [Flavobacteriales bacterium]
MKKIINRLNTPFRYVKFGMITIYEPLNDQIALTFKEYLEEQGFDYVFSRQARQIE